jgi:3-phosphoshikimate 1-carboxyvinyltransferase
MSDLRLDPISKPFAAHFTPPGSKSLTNRALVLSALADGVCDLANVLFADDTLVMLEGLAKLGFYLVIDHDGHTVRVHGRGGHIDKSHAELFCGNSGTTIRFLTALCALGKGSYTLDGIARMRQRPIKVDADGLPGGMLQYGSEMSSQYLSALLMVAPYARNEVRIDLAPRQTSWPYVAMTMQLMDLFGVTPELIRDPKSGEPKQIIVPRGVYRPTNYSVEPDASNATYFLAAAAVNPESKITIEGLGKSSLQGDVGFADLLHRMGAELVFGKDFITIKGPELLEGIEADLSGMPDVAQTLAVVSLFADGPTTLRGLHTLRVKETDRIAALANELAKLGAEVEVEGNDAITITPPEDNKLKPASIATYDDHRMAMSFAVAGLAIPGVRIADPDVVGKSFPRFWDTLSGLGITTR